MKLKNKKAGLLNIVFLTFLTLVLVTFVLISFNIRSKNALEMTITNIEVLYAKEELINFYVDTLIDSIIRENPEISQEEFQKKFNEQLKLYKSNGYYTVTEMNQIEGQTQKITLQNQKLKFPLTITVTGQENGIYVSYTYTKTFEQAIPEAQNI